MLTAPKPKGGVGRIATPETSDDFAGPELATQWQWQANPQPGWAELSDHEGGIRLRCVPISGGAPLWQAGQLLMQKFPAPEFEASVELTLTALAEGDRAGLVVFGYDYAWIGLRRGVAGVRLVFAVCAGAREGGAEDECEVRRWERDAGAVKLAVAVSSGAVCRFSFTDETGRTEVVVSAWQARSSKWVGAKVGLFAATDAPGSDGAGKFTQFNVTPLTRE